jgi:hypothetical protein
LLVIETAVVVGATDRQLAAAAMAFARAMAPSLDGFFLDYERKVAAGNVEGAALRRTQLTTDLVGYGDYPYRVQCGRAAMSALAAVGDASDHPVDSFARNAALDAVGATMCGFRGPVARLLGRLRGLCDGARRHLPTPTLAAVLESTR